MNTIDIVITTLLALIAIGSLVSWTIRTQDLRDKLWVEPAIILTVLLFIYLVVRDA